MPCGWWQQSQFKNLTFYYFFLMIQEAIWMPLLFVCASGCGDILLHAITYNTLTSAGLKMKVLSGWRTLHASAFSHSPSIMCFQKFVVSVSRGPRRFSWQSLLFLPSFTIIQAFRQTSTNSPRGALPARAPRLRHSVFYFVWLFYCQLQIPSLGIMTTISSIFTNVIKLILCSMRGLFLNSSWYA